MIYNEGRYKRLTVDKEGNYDSSNLSAVFLVRAQLCIVSPIQHPRQIALSGLRSDDFNDFHPSCAIMTCNKKKENVAFCFECSNYPCDRYLSNEKDSFISYINRNTDMAMAKNDLQGYLAVLEEKSRILSHLLKHHDDGRSKSFYCLAVNLLEIEDLREAYNDIEETTEPKKIREILLETAEKRGISIILRK
jgi:hypothetical protein